MTPQQKHKALRAHHIPVEFRVRGWHFCPVVDGDLIGPGVGAYDLGRCTCQIRRQVEMAKLYSQHMIHPR
jgi:hypothetical protein